MLCKEVLNYISTAKGLPFFFVVGDSSYNSALGDLKQAGLSVVRMSDFCPKDDKFPSIDELIDFFRTSDVDYRDNKFIVIGLGEYLAIRGSDYADKELRRLKNTTLGNARVILLLRGVRAQIERILSEDQRIIEQQRAFVSDDYFTDITLTNVIGGYGLVDHRGIKPILRLLENGACNTVYSSSDLVFHESLFPVTAISDAHSVIRLMLKDFPFEKSLGTSDQWEHLLKDLNSNNKSLQEVFNKYSIDDRIFDELNYIVSGLEYKNWLAFLYFKANVETFQNTYFQWVVQSTSTHEDLKRNLLVKITSITHSDTSYRRLYDDRKRLLKGFPEEDIAIFIKENEIDPEECIYRLTDNTLIEKKTVIKWIVKNGICDAISFVYPALYDYLRKYIFDSPVLADELTAYFDIYKKLKVTNCITEEFITRVEHNAKKLVYAQLPTRDNAIKSISDKKNAYLYWIDALGVEYMAYITSLAKKKGLSIHTDFVRSDLPTITSINKGFYDQWTGGKKYKEKELDEIKHKEQGGYFFTDDEDPIHLPAELNVIERAINTAAMELGMHHCKSFVIASDHGASRLAVIKKQEVPYDTDTKGEHSGRCCKVFDNCDAPYKVEDNGFIILSDYGRFRKSRAANVEVHGGASLEEIVVPVITLTLRKQAGVQIVVLHPDDIFADRHDGTTIQLYISDVESVGGVHIVVDDKNYNGETEDGSHFTFKLEDIKRAKAKPYNADVFDGSDLIGTISFRIKGKTATIKEDFDFGNEF